MLLWFPLAVRAEKSPADVYLAPSRKALRFGMTGRTARSLFPKSKRTRWLLSKACDHCYRSSFPATTSRIALANPMHGK